MSTVVQRRLMVINQGGGVAAVGAVAPLLSSGGAAPDISVTPGAAPGDLLVWNGTAWVVSSPTVAIAPAFEWNLDGLLSGAPIQPPGGFDGMATSNPALLGPGPFDGARVVTRPGTIVLSGFVLRVSAVPVTFVEFYRIRAGIVASLGPVVGLGATGNAFSGVSTVPSVTDLLPGDLVFIALAEAAVGAEDLSAYLQVTP